MAQQTTAAGQTIARVNGTTAHMSVAAGPYRDRYFVPRHQ